MHFVDVCTLSFVDTVLTRVRWDMTDVKRTSGRRVARISSCAGRILLDRSQQTHKPAGSRRAGAAVRTQARQPGKQR